MPDPVQHHGAAVATPTPAELRRTIARYPDAAFTALELDIVALAGPLSVDALREVLAAYLLDLDGLPIADARVGVARWIDNSPLALRLGPGSGAPIDDQVAAAIAAPALIGSEGLLPSVRSRRLAPRADTAIAAAITQLADEHALAEIEALVRDALPDEDILHRGLLQAGRALAGAAARLAGTPSAAALVDRLLALLVPSSAEPVLDGVVAALGPMAAIATPLGARIRERAMALVEEHMSVVDPPRLGGSFLAEFENLRRGTQSEDWVRTLPRRRVAKRAVELVGRGAAHGDARALRARAVERWSEPMPLLAAFAAGLAASADRATLGALVVELLGGDGDQLELGLTLAAESPIDGCAQALLGLVTARDPDVRLLAVSAITLLPPDAAIPALANALDDEDPEVCAAAAVALRDNGRGDLLEARRLRGLADDRRLASAAIRAAIPDHDHAVLTELIAAIGVRLEDADELLARGDDHDVDEAEQILAVVAGSPITAVLGRALTSSATGIERTIQLLREIPDALRIVALAVGTVVPGVALPAALFERLDEAVAAATAESPEAEAMGLGLLAHFARGHTGLSDRIVAGLRRTPDGAADLLAALVSLGVRSAAAADLLVPLLDQLHDLPTRGIAAAAAGSVAPTDHPLWERIREMIGLGTVLDDAAHHALIDRARALTSPR